MSEEQKRHKKKWKGVASKLSHAFKKHHRGGDNMKHVSESESPSLPESSSSTELDRNDRDVVSPADSDFVSRTSSTQDIPPPLSGGVVVDTKYALSATELNVIIFDQGSAFTRELLRTQKSSDYVAEPWRRASDGSLTRSVSYTRAPTKLVKAVRAHESQRYVVALDEGFCVLLSTSTPDAPYGSTFVVETQVVILALPDLPSGDKFCHLQVSWQLKFLHSTMMKAMIESGARNGIGESYAVYEDVLSHHAPPLSPRSAQTSDCEAEKLISDWEIAWDLVTQWDVLLALLSLSFMMFHIALARPKPSSGLEFWIIRFPDSLMELFVSAIVVVQVERVVIMVYNFIRSYYLQSADHGVKAQDGDGWIVKASLLEGVNIAHCHSGTPSPFVVFTCSNKHRTSSPNLGTTHPTWQEFFEFDPVEDPPSTMEVEVFHYEGPFSEAESLGRGEINFLKQSPGELTDYWLPLQRKGAQENGSELHLCVYLVNAREGDTILPEYLEHIEREVGLKVRKRSAHKNGYFQKLFSLPAEEFLMNDFACAIKRKILTQGRLYLSPRLLGFYSNLFGHKTKFMLLWEDIEEIKESVAQSINPSITLFTRKGSGYDARHGARGVDGKGRLEFQLLSFVRPGSAFRAIVALWKNVSLSKCPNMDVLARLEAGDMKYTTVAKRQADELREEVEASMSEVLQMQIPITVESLNVVIEDDQKDRLLHEKLGLSDYESSPWEVVADGIQRRHRHYTLERPVTLLGSRISSVQQKTMTSSDFNKLVIDDNFTFDDVPCGDHFQMQVRMELEALSMHPITTQYKAFGGVVWHEGTELDQRKMTKNVYEHMTNQLRCLVQLLVEEARG